SPQQSPEFVISVEAHSMINAEYPTGAAKDVAALAIGIVDQYVEHGEQSQIGYVGVDHRDRTIFAIEAFNRGKPVLLGQRRAWNKINKLVGGDLVDIHPDLKRSRPERSFSQHRDRHTVEAADAGHLVRGYLTKAKGAVREIPERPLPFQRLVDTLDRRLTRLQLREEGRVGRVQQAARDLQLSLRELCRQRGVGRPGVTMLRHPPDVFYGHRTISRTAAGGSRSPEGRCARAGRSAA